MAAAALTLYLHPFLHPATFVTAHKVARRHRGDPLRRPNATLTIPPGGSQSASITFSSSTLYILFTRATYIVTPVKQVRRTLQKEANDVDGAIPRGNVEH
jgi:hypothetical protein